MMEYEEARDPVPPGHGERFVDPWNIEAETPSAPVVPDEPIDEQHQYGIYTLVRVDEELMPQREATTSKAGIGTALLTLAEDRRQAGLQPAVFGVKDRINRRWEATLWHPKEER